jgi:hypothetical protein
LPPTPFQREHITNTKNKYDEAQRKIERFTDKLTGLAVVEAEKLEEPEPEEKSLLPDAK